MDNVLASERAVMFHTLELLRTKKITLADFGKEENLQVTPEMNKLAMEQADYGQFLLLTYMNESISIAKMPTQEQTARFAKWENDIRGKMAEVRASPQKDGVTGLVLIPAVVKVHAAQMRQTALIRTAIVGLAVERYRRTNKVWPANLNALVPQYLTRLPVDPYTGKPLIYQFYNEGVAIISVGAQMRQPPASIGDMDRLSVDSVQAFRLWNRNLRRSPVAKN